MRFFLFKITVDFAVMWEYTVSTGGVSMAFNIKLAVKNAMLGLRGVTVSPLPELIESPHTLKPSPIAEFYVRTQISQLEQELLCVDSVDLKKYKEDEAIVKLANRLSESGAITHDWQTTPEGKALLVSSLRVVLPKKKEE